MSDAAAPAAAAIRPVAVLLVAGCANRRHRPIHHDFWRHRLLCRGRDRKISAWSLPRIRVRRPGARVVERTFDPDLGPIGGAATAAAAGTAA